MCCILVGLLNINAYLTWENNSPINTDRVSIFQSVWYIEMSYNVEDGAVQLVGAMTVVLQQG